VVKKEVLLTKQTTPWSRVVLENMRVAQLFKKLPIFHGTQKFITVKKDPTNGPYPEASEHSSIPHNPLL